MLSVGGAEGVEMLSFEAAVRTVDETGVPVVEAIAVRIASGASREASVEQATVEEVKACLDDKSLPGWKATPSSGRWWVFDRSGRLEPQRFSLGSTWDLIRRIRELEQVEDAEPLLLGRLPVATEAEAQERFRLWGKVSPERLAEIRRASEERHWSLRVIGVCDVKQPGGAWATWKDRFGDGRLPGDGIVVAHPDTGYTRHPRLLGHLLPRPDAKDSFGWSFVDPAADALDPLQGGPGRNPGHGTATASVIVAGSEEAQDPWGVAPGAKILPLRVSSSVVHWSFENLRRALLAALEEKVHVVSMSFGGPYDSGALAAVVRELLDQGVIVVAAAGNMAPTVVFPARLPGVVACAASNAKGSPWRFSGMGDEVVVTAPGELVWHDVGHDDEVSGVDRGSGTSYATAHVAGLAALWLSYHGRDDLIDRLGGGARGKRLLPFLFRHCLVASADVTPTFVREGKGGFGAGIVHADRLLAADLPPAATIHKLRESILARSVDSLVDAAGRHWRTILTFPTFAAGGEARPPAAEKREERAAAVESFLAGRRGLVRRLDEGDRAEIGLLAAADDTVGRVLARVAEGPGGPSAAALCRYLLRRPEMLSGALAGKLRKARTADLKAWKADHSELATKPIADEEGGGKGREDERDRYYDRLQPAMRRLRAYAFDPSLATRFEEAGANEIIIQVAFEKGLLPGPVGDYVEVIDVDPASDCVYAPVDLDHPYLLAQDGLPRSEGDPRFHQQMVYAVAMKTIGHFEEALGRPIFWSPLRPWDKYSDDRRRALLDGKSDPPDQFVRRLRLYPHALREQNAYYSPQKRAILFGYFPAGDADPGAEQPGGVVFTCLAHDIIAHEVTHAILDGMHLHFKEPTNPDVLAFHEAFADLVALLQRFTYTELVRDQIARVRGRLGAGTLLTRLGLQFGRSTGRGQALRDALGFALEQRRRKGDTEWRDVAPDEEEDGSVRSANIEDSVRNLSDEERRRVWKRFEADPRLLEEVLEPHARGSFLVAAVFDAFVRIYEARVADLQRIATGGTGVLPEGDLHPDLVARMAGEAAKVAGQVLRICIRAMDYVPPLDITFGDFLRALITADADLVPHDPRRYRVAFIEAFRKWGIYPRDVRTLSEESLRWSSLPDGDRVLELNKNEKKRLDQVRAAVLAWQPGETRKSIFERVRDGQKHLHRLFTRMTPARRARLLQGIDPDKSKSFQIRNLRPARRIGQRGEFFTEMVVEILQLKRLDTDLPAGSPPFRAGLTLIIGMNDGRYEVRYAIYKRADSERRQAQYREQLLRAGGAGRGAAEYSSQGFPPGWLTDGELAAPWRAGRTSDLDHMRASSCACRRQAMERNDKKTARKKAKAKERALEVGIGLRALGDEPFALLHRP